MLGRLPVVRASGMEASLEESFSEDGDAGESEPKSSSESDGGRIVIPIILICDRVGNVVYCSAYYVVIEE